MTESANPDSTSTSATNASATNASASGASATNASTSGASATNASASNASATNEIDVDALMAEIRAEVMQARTAGGALPAAAGPAPGEGWYGVLDQLRLAEQHAAVGVEVPPFGRYGGVKRRLARAAARVVLFLTQVIAQPQRTYNTSTLAALRMLAERVQALEAELAALRARQAPGSGGGRAGRDAAP